MASKEIDLQILVSTLKIQRKVFKEVFKVEFDWKKEYYFELFVGSFRFCGEPFTLQEYGKF